MRLIFNSMLRNRLAGFAGVMFLLLVFSGGVCFAGNIVAESIITASSLPNPAWAPENVSDGDTGPTKGWIGEWNKGNPDLWLQFTFPSVYEVSSMRVMQAGLPEAGRNRFSRPKKIRVIFFSGGGSTEKTLELKDREHIFQDVEMEPAEANVIRIEVQDVYPGTRIEEMAGFQEIEIIAAGAPVRAEPGAGKGAKEMGELTDTEIADAVRDAMSRKAASVGGGESDAKKEDEGKSGDKKTDGSDAGAEEGGEKNKESGVTKAERDILLLLGELMKRLEKHFEDN